MSGSFPTLPIFTWGNRPPANSVPMGTAIRISDVGVAPGIVVVSDGVNWVPQGMQLLGRTGAASSVTGTTSETALATTTVPAGLLGPNGGILVYSAWTGTNSANNKTPRVRLGGIAGDQYYSQPFTTSATLGNVIARIRNRGVVNSQVGGAAANVVSGSGLSNSALVTGAKDSTGALDVVLSGQLALGTETLTLENSEVWVTA